MKARKKINELNKKTMKWMDDHPTSKKVLVGTAVGIGLVAMGYILGNRKKKKSEE